MNGPRASHAAALALAVLVALPGCYARRSIPSESEARTEAQVREEAARAKAEEAKEKEAQARADEARAKADEAKAKAEEAKAKAAIAAAEARKAEVQAAAAPKPEPAPVEQKAQAEAAKTEAVKADVKPAAAPRQPVVQIASFLTQKNAEGALAWLKTKGYADGRLTQLEQGQQVFHRVQAGPFQDLAAAQKALEELKPDWPQAFIPAD